MSETADQARTRRRWITLAEFVAVAGLLVAAATLYFNWADRRDERAQKAASEHSAAEAKARLDLSATVEDDGRVLRLADASHELADVTIAFPRPLAVPAEHPADAAIHADPVAAPMLRLTDGGADQRSGRLPVLITVSYWDGETARKASGIYDLIWRTEGHVLRGRSFRFSSMRLRQPGGSQAALNRLWAHEKP